eukprot:4091219-Amphidinium_carterae.1
MPAAVERAFIDAERACARGLGPSQSAAGIPLGDLSRLPLKEAPLALPTALRANVTVATPLGALSCSTSLASSLRKSSGSSKITSLPSVEYHTPTHR